VNINKLVVWFLRRPKTPRIAKIILKNNKGRELAVPDLKA
jgi:hypothetical protein